MPRKARKYLNTSFIHVMVQGVNKEFIFANRRHLMEYLRYIREIEEDGQIELLAYCMMNNHAHFLFYVKNFDYFEKYMHKNNLRFAQMYNRDKNRCGVVFRNRYKIEPIYNINHLSNCIKYIHNNPVKAKIVDKCDYYPFSSYMEYANNIGVAKSEILKEVFGEDTNYLDIINNSYDRNFMDYEKNKNMREYIEAGIIEFMKRYHNSLIEIVCEKETLVDMVKFLKEECNIAYRDIIKYFEMPISVCNNASK